MQTCKNCGTEFDGNFCPNCGQKPNNGRIIFRESVRDILEHYFDFDTPLFRTIKGLITNPGKIIKEYIHGRRKSYSHPFRYFILVLALYLIIKSLIDFNPIAAFSEVLGAREMPNPNSPQTKGGDFFSNHINSFLLIYALALASLSKLFNRKSGYYFVEYLSMSFFVIAEYMFFSIFIMLLTLTSPYFFIANYVIVFLYPMYVLVSFHEGKIFSRLIKAFFISFFAWLLYAILGQTISIFIVILFGL